MINSDIDNEHTFQKGRQETGRIKYQPIIHFCCMTSCSLVWCWKNKPLCKCIVVSRSMSDYMYEYEYEYEWHLCFLISLFNILSNTILFCVNIFIFYVQKAKSPITVPDIFHQSTRRHVQRCAKNIYLKLHNARQIAHYILYCTLYSLHACCTQN